MLLSFHHVDCIDIPSGKLDVTDPCYKRDVWCRLNDIAVKPGCYECCVYYGENYNEKELIGEELLWDEFNKGESFEKFLEKNRSDIRNRCFAIMLVHSDKDFNVPVSLDEWKQIGEIGVDSGLAGFILSDHLPPENASDRNQWWSDFIERTSTDEKEPYIDEEVDDKPRYQCFHVWSDLGFFASTGYGDGCYAVYAYYENDTIVALRIEFL